MTPAGWYPDPTAAAELRWFDGDAWTDHVATAGRSFTAPVAGEPAPDAATPPTAGAPPLPGAGRSPLTAASLHVSRPPQPRGQGSWLDVYDGDGPLGRFVETVADELDDAAIVRLSDPAGAPVLSVVHPGRGTRARVDGPAGPLGWVTRVGRVRSNLVLHGPGATPAGEPLATLRPLEDGTGWAAEDGPWLAVWVLGQPSAAAYAEARYELSTAGADPALRPLLLALPVLVDRALTQDARQIS